MMLHARIREEVDLKDGDKPQSVIVEFVNDKNKQYFEVLFYEIDPYREGMRKWDIWELNIKWKSEIFIDPKTNKRSYFTHLVCNKVKPILQLQK